MHHKSDVNVPSSFIHALRNFVISLHGAIGSLFPFGGNSGQCPNVGFLNRTIGTGSRRSEVPATTHFAGVLEAFLGETYFVSFILLANGVLLKFRGFQALCFD